MEQTDVQDVRVVLFGLGTVGAAVARTVMSREGLVCVAAVDVAESRVGRDLGEVAGLGVTTDVVVEGSAETLDELEADVVIFAPTGDAEEASANLELLLEQGLNVICVFPELAYPPDEDDDDELAASIDTLAREAEVTALALDPSDALLGTLPLSLTAHCSSIDRVVVRRRGGSSTAGRLSLADWARSLAGSLGWALDDLDEMEEDRGRAHRVSGSSNGREVLLVEVLAGTAAEATLDVQIEGTPSFSMTIAGGEDADQALATLAVNAVPAVLTGEPGLYTIADLPPVHCWTSLGLVPADEDDED